VDALVTTRFPSLPCRLGFRHPAGIPLLCVVITSLQEQILPPAITRFLRFFISDARQLPLLNNIVADTKGIAGSSPMEHGTRMIRSTSAAFRHALQTSAVVHQLHASRARTQHRCLIIESARSPFYLFELKTSAASCAGSASAPAGREWKDGDGGRCTKPGPAFIGRRDGRCNCRMVECQLM